MGLYGPGERFCSSKIGVGSYYHMHWWWVRYLSMAGSLVALGVFLWLIFIHNSIFHGVTLGGQDIGYHSGWLMVFSVGYFGYSTYLELDYDTSVGWSYWSFCLERPFFKKILYWLSLGCVSQLTRHEFYSSSPVIFRGMFLTTQLFSGPLPSAVYIPWTVFRLMAFLRLLECFVYINCRNSWASFLWLCLLFFCWGEVKAKTYGLADFHLALPDSVGIFASPLQEGLHKLPLGTCECLKVSWGDIIAFLLGWRGSFSRYSFHTF